MDYQSILSQIREAFIHQDRFSGDKKVVDFFDTDNHFQGDIYNFYIRELLADGSPQYYTTTSPYDVSWKSAPQQALVFHGEKLIFSTDFTEAVKIRTGCMDTIFLHALGVQSISDKKILIVGSGGTAKYSYLFLKDSFADIGGIDYTNRSGKNTEFESLGHLRYVETPDLSEYDIILLHAHVDEPYLKTAHKNQIKDGAIIISYGGKTPECDIDPAFFTSAETVIVDMHTNIENLKPLKIALEKGSINQEEVIDLGQLIRGESTVDTNKHITVCISGGTYIQNIAMMKYMMNNKS